MFQYLLENLLKHETLLDYVENFILFENKRMKILAKNHQFQYFHSFIFK
jgi:type I restriction enzyme R subunit